MCYTMPRPGPRRPIVNVRISQAGIDRVDGLAKEADVNRSEMIRRLLAYGVRHMPRDWRP